MKNHLLTFLLFSLFISSGIYPQGINFDTVKAQKYDMGKMWTFENPPIDYFESAYGIKVTDAWLEHLQKGALKFGGGCSASFISEDGLIMTNHHCVRGILPSLQKENENILKDGFYASTLDQERKVPNLKVEQLLVIEDVTRKILDAMEKGNTDDEKLKILSDISDEIISGYQKEYPDLTFRIISLYNGGKYSLYGFKVYSDIRLVFVPELFVAKLGGDYDNFTYPRYGLDCAFLRAYENDKPIKAQHFFKWDLDEITEDQPVFVVGNPGSTDRINTIAQIEYARDIQYPMYVGMFKDLYEIYFEQVMSTNAEDFKLIARLYSIGNALKVYDGTYKALLDPVLMARKKDFEKTFKDAVQSDPELNKKYGKIWDELAASRNEAAQNARKMFAYQVSNTYSPQYLIIAKNLIKYAQQFKNEEINKAEYDSLTSKLYPDDLNAELENSKLLVQLYVIEKNLPPDDKIYQYFIGTKKVKDAQRELLSKTIFTSKKMVDELISKDPNEILSSDDPFIYFVLNTQDELNKMIEESKARNQKEKIANQMLGEALFAVYGDAIPPDATGTLRISDGIVKGYDYNGTRAPYKTTFYGSLDRYYSFDKKFPFNLPAYWEDLPKEFDLSVSLNFVTTSDIIGGNSGSPVLNAKGEIVGLAFDGNMESLPSAYIYTTEANRTVAVTAVGMIEAIRDLYKAARLSNEILNSKMEE